SGPFNSHSAPNCVAGAAQPARTTKLMRTGALVLRVAGIIVFKLYPAPRALSRNLESKLSQSELYCPDAREDAPRRVCLRQWQRFPVGGPHISALCSKTRTSYLRENRS